MLALQVAVEDLEGEVLVVRGLSVCGALSPRVPSRLVCLLTVECPVSVDGLARVSCVWYKKMASGTFAQQL